MGWTADLFGVPGTGGEQGAPPLIGLLAGPVFTLREWLVLDIGGIVPVVGKQPRAFYSRRGLERGATRAFARD